MIDRELRVEITRDEACAMLELSHRQIDRLIRLGALEHVRYPNRQVRIYLDSAQQVLNERPAPRRSRRAAA